MRMNNNDNDNDNDDDNDKTIILIIIITIFFLGGVLLLPSTLAAICDSVNSRRCMQWK